MAKRDKKLNAVREPVQVYLESPDRALLDQLAEKAGVSRAEVLRRGLRAYGAEIFSTHSPVLRLLEDDAGESLPGAPVDVAERHDHYLTEWELERWSKPE